MIHHPSSQEFNIRYATLEDMDFIMDLAKQEGWNPGLYDARCFYNLDPQGFWIGELAGEKIGCISAVRYEDHFGFLGLYIVRPPFRHRGFGIQLWRTAIEAMGNRNIGLDGVIEQQTNYKKSGFHLAYRNIRFTAVGKSSPSQHLQALSEIPWAQLVEYDRRCFPADRINFLKEWIEMPNTYSYGIQKKGKLVGYGVIRTCVRGYKIGPLFADDLETAEQLFDELSNHAQKEPIFIDIPEVNQSALQLVQKKGMQKSFETARMYTKQVPAVDLNKIYGITTFEVG